MAVPTISNVSPDAGPSRGRVLITVEGTGFREPPAPPLTGPTTSPGPTVKVEFGSVEADRVWVVSSTELLVRTPAKEPGVHDITVTNLDDDGDPIAGETVTEASSYTTSLPDLTASTVLTRVMRTLILEMRKQVLSNTKAIVHSEYDEDTGDLLSIIPTAELPALVVIGPRLRQNRFYSTNETDEKDLGALVGQIRPKRTEDLIFTVVGASDNTTELTNLLAHFTDFLQLNIYLRMDRDEADPSAGQVQYEMEFEAEPSAASEANASNIRYFTSDLVIRGVDVEPGDMVVGKVAEMADYVPAGSVDPERAWIEWTVEQYLSEP